MKRYKKTLLVICYILALGILAYLATKDSQGDTAICDYITFKYADDESLTIHPFKSKEGLVVALPPTMDSTDLVLAETNGEDKAIKFIHSELNTVFITTSSENMDDINASEDKSHKEAGTAVFLSSTGEKTKVKLKSIGGRGNISWKDKTFKKPYCIKFEEKIQPFNLNKSKRFELLSTNVFSSYFSLQLAERLNCSSSHPSILVSLYLNGHYNGVYVMTNHVDISKHSVNISETKSSVKKDAANTVASEDNSIRYVESAKSPADITGGYIIENLNWGKVHYDVCKSGFKVSDDTYFHLKAPKYASKKQVEYISKQYKDMYKAVEQSDDSVSGKTYKDYLCIGSFARYYLVQEAVCNGDGGYGSLYLYKDTDKKDGRFHAGPIWDMDWVMAIDSLWQYYNYPESFYVRAGGVSKYQRLFHNLFKHKEFRDSVKCIYANEMYPMLSQAFEQSSFRNSFTIDKRLEDLRFNSDTRKGDLTAELFMKKRITYLYKYLVEEDMNECCTVTIDANHKNRRIMFVVKKGSPFNIPNIHPLVSSSDQGEVEYKMIGWFEDGKQLKSTTQVIDSNKEYYSVSEKKESLMRRIKNKYDKFMAFFD